jgi:hypothetical protein
MEAVGEFRGLVGRTRDKDAAIGQRHHRLNVGVGVN